MKKFIISSLISFLSVFIFISGVAYYFYGNVLDGYVDKRIERTVYINNLSTRDAIVSQIDYNIMLLDTFYSENNSDSLASLNEKIKDVKLLNCKNIVFAEYKNSYLHFENEQYEIKEGFSFSNFKYEKFSIINLTEAFKDCNLNRCVVFFLDDNHLAITSANDFLETVLNMNREYEPEAFIINKNGYIYYQNGDNYGDYFYSDYLSSVSTNKEKEDLINSIANKNEGVDSKYYVRGERCYLTYNEISISGQSESFYLMSVFYKKSLLKFEKSLLVPLLLLLISLSFILIVGLGWLYIICLKKNEDIQLSKIALYYCKPYVLRVNKKGKIIFKNSSMKKLNVDWNCYKFINDFKFDSESDILEDIKKNKHFIFHLVDLEEKDIVFSGFSLKVGFVNYIICDDITKEYNEASRAINKINYDESTNLQTGEVLLKDLNSHLRFISETQQKGIIINSSLVILCIDSLDRYTSIFGNKLSSKIVLSFKNLLDSTLDENATLYRLEKDTFAILFKTVESYSDIINWISNFKTILKKPIEIDSNTLVIKFHCGVFNIELDQYDKLDNNMVYEYAEIAFQRAKGLNVSDYIIYNISLGKLVKREQLMEEDLRKAIDNDELVVYIQPQCSTNDRKIIGFEALTRWKNPKYINDSPQHFIELAEKNNLIIPIGKVITKQALEIAKKLEGKNITISINVSPAQLIQDGFVTQMIEMTEEAKVDPKMIALEITETFLVQNIKLIAEKLKVLKKYGFIIHLDDFGTGYSSMLYLKDLPIDAIKIDKEFIKYINTDKNSRVIVSKIISLATSLGMEIIAEGVEDEKQYQFLSKNGCRVVQGWLISKALPFEEALVLIEEYNSK